MSRTPDDLEQRGDELSGRVSPKLDPGPAAVVVAVGVLVLLCAFALPWTGKFTGWQVLAGADGLGMLPLLFGVTSVLFGVVGSSAALMTRLWAIGWACALGCGFSVVSGLWAIWSRQTAPGGGPGPGLGMVVGVAAMVLLTLMWVRLAWSRPGGREHG